MTPKEKAIELVENFHNNVSTHYKNMSISASIDCARIAVDEILKANAVWYEGSIPYKYWTKVKKEINNL